MIIKKCLIVFLLIIPIYAATTDDEIIKNLDFFQNIELLKDDNPYLVEHTASPDQPTSSDVLEKEKVK